MRYVLLACVQRSVRRRPQRVLGNGSREDGVGVVFMILKADREVVGAGDVGEDALFLATQEKSV